jgi:hypothetical protein
MSNLIVLGIIPGTNIQLGFFWWLLGFVLLGGAIYTARQLRRAQTIRFMLIHASLVLTMRRRQRA